jgi:glycosyltransferase involved in cell wall biosynthesis
MKIQAYMPVYNEADVLSWTLRHLHEQGCAVHVLDSSSSDGSYAIACREADSVETFPAISSPVWCLGDVLRRVEDLAAASDAYWCLYTDADEWRMSAIPGERLIDGIARLDEMGYNCIDFRVLAFFCTDAGWPGSGLSPERYFRYYSESDMICKIANRRLWKNTGRVTLAGGGHDVQFPGRRIPLEHFIMRHYPYRTPEQARRKIESRLARRSKEEHRRGWGVHYDQPFPPDFCWRPEDLRLFPPEKQATIAP